MDLLVGVRYFEMIVYITSDKYIDVVDIDVRPIDVAAYAYIDGT